MIGKWVIGFAVPTNKYLALSGRELTHYPEEAMQFTSLEAALSYLDRSRQRIEALGSGARPGRIRD